MVETMQNEVAGVRMWVENRLPIPPCCPVSTNPRPGSTLTLRYRAPNRVLEVYSLKRYVDEFIGGHADGTRNMEAMIRKIAQTAADALGVPVRAVADLYLLPAQELRLVCSARPGRPNEPEKKHD